MITVTTDLDKQIPAGNPAWLACRTDNYRLVAGTLGIWTFTMTGTPDTDSTFTFNFGDYSIVMTAKVAPDTSGYQTNKPADVVTFDTFVNDCLHRNYYLNKHFTITHTAWSAGVGTFTLTQKDYDPDTVLTTSFSSSPDSKTAPTSTTAAVAQSFQENFKLKCDIVHLYDRTDLTKTRTIATLESTPKLDGSYFVSTFDFQRVLRSLVSHNAPAFGETTHALCLSQLANFGYILYEVYGDPIMPYFMFDNSQPAQPWQALLSRLLFADHIALDFNAQYCTNTYRKLLHNRPALLRTNAAAPQYIYSYIKRVATAAKTYMQVFYEDGTFTAPTLVRTLSLSYYDGDIVRSAVGYNALGIGALDPSLVVDYYKVWMADSAGTRVTEEYSFSVDLAPYEQNNYLLFSNPLGGFDTAWLRGELGFNKDYFGDQTVNAILPGYTAGNINSRNTGSQWQYEFNSGQLANREELRHMCQIAEAEEVYYVGASSLVKLVVDRKSLEMIDNTMENLFSLSFKCRVANLEI